MVVRDPRTRQIMAFERTDTTGAWQLPQGGLDAGEAPIDGAWRELAEETGLTSADLTLVDEYPEWLAYAWPPEVKASPTYPARAKPNRLGQVQRWFLFETLHADVTPMPDGREFGAWQWCDPHWLVHQVVDFRRPAYIRVLMAWTG